MTAAKQRFPYFKFYPQDWLDATRMMSLEERGAYIDVICLLMIKEGQLADDEAWLSHQMHISTRKYRAVKKRLIESGKLRIEGGLIVNERCLKELDALLSQRRNVAEAAANRERTKRESPLTQSQVGVENPKNSNENNDASTTRVPIAHAHTHARQTPDSDKKKTTQTARAPRTTAEIDALRDKLLAAANGALANPAACPGLLLMSEPIRWMDQGCNLEQDILPAVRARAHKARPNSVKSWSYFTDAVAEAKARREAPMPDAVQASSGRPPLGSLDERRKREQRDYLSREIAQRSEIKAARRRELDALFGDGGGGA